MKEGANDMVSQVIDPQRWLVHRAETLIEEEAFEEAIDYVRRLEAGIGQGSARGRCQVYLGYLYVIVGDATSGKRWLEEAESQGVADAHVSYALGHLESQQGRWAAATLRFLEAYLRSTNPLEQAEFLRCAAMSMADGQGPTQTAVSMLLGAQDRDLRNPWILDGLARIYEADGRWLDSLEILSVLESVVTEARDSLVVHRAPRMEQLLRNRLMGKPVRPLDLEKRAEAINQALRERFEVVLDAEKVQRGPSMLAALDMPRTLKRLVEVLEWQERAPTLVERAHRLWARSSKEGFGELLGEERQAAAIQMLVERLDWRIATPVDVLARIHGADEEAIDASARLIAGRLGLEPFDRWTLGPACRADELRRLDEVVRGVLFGEAPEGGRQSALRLGG